MRRSAPVLVGLLAAAVFGVLLAALSAPAVTWLACGVMVAGAITATRVPTDRLMWLTVCLFVLTVTWNGIRLAGGAFGNAFLVLATMAVATHVFVTRRPLVLPPWLLLAGLGMFASWLATALVPPPPSLLNISDLQVLTRVVVPAFSEGRPDFPAFLKFEVALVLLPVVLVAAATSRRRATTLLDLFVLSAVVNAAVGCADFSGLQLGPYPLDGTRAAGLTLHPNYLALTCTIALPLAMLWMARRQVRWQLAGLAAVVLLLGGEYASGSRAGAATAILGVIATMAVLPPLRRRLPLVLPVFGMAAVAVLLWTSVGDQILEQVRVQGDATSTAGSNFQRRQAADVGWTQIQARPLSGVGMQVITDAHSIYLELLAAGGVILLAAWLVFIGGVLRSARRAFLHGYRNEAAAGSVAVGMWLINGILDNQLADKYLYVVPGIILAFGRLARRPGVVRPAAPLTATEGAERGEPDRDRELVPA